jgi:hypothetical protein
MDVLNPQNKEPSSDEMDKNIKELGSDLWGGDEGEKKGKSDFSGDDLE